MPRFYFRVRDGDCEIRDDEGKDLPDARAAQTVGAEIARELMQGREAKVRLWCLDIFDGEGGAVTTVPFTRVDPTLDHLTPDLRELVERLSESRREVHKTLVSTGWLKRELQAMRARSQKKPYAITHNGQRVGPFPVAAGFKARS